jgi:aryl-alcohol dehydrogenase (NADP+)
VGLIPWSPLARGFLTGSRSKKDYGGTTRAKTDTYAHRMYYRDDDFAIVERVVELAEKRGVTPAQTALAWMLHKPGVTSPIIGATKTNHLEEAIAAVDIELSDEEVGSLEELYQPHPIRGHD